MRVTKQTLLDAGATCDQPDKFAAEWPDGVEVTRSSISRAAQIGLDLDWFAEYFLDYKAQQAYEAAIAPAWKAYEAAIAQAQQACDAAIAQEWQAYKAAIATAQQACDAAIAQEWQAYKAAIAQAQQAYKAAIAPAWKAYEAAIATALADAMGLP